jgi:hypothetical protein
LALDGADHGVAGRPVARKGLGRGRRNVMSSDIARDLTRIGAGVEKLNSRADVLTKQVMALSQRLRDLQVGVTCYLTRECYESRTQGADGSAVPCCYYIGFGRADDGKWGITVVCRMGKDGGHVPGPDAPRADEATTLWIRPFESCPRDVRLALAVYVPQVVSGLADTVENLIASAETSLENLARISAELEGALAKAHK